jgi:hypothetical protein
MLLCIDAPPGLDEEQERIRAVFGLSPDAPLPQVNLLSLTHYRDYLSARLTFPFHALYAESTPPVRHLVRYVTLVGLRSEIGFVSGGLLCEVENVPHGKSLPLAEIGVREDNPNYQLLDDYAYWFYNWR